MIFKKQSETGQIQNKKYLLVVLALIIIAAAALSLANIIKGGKNAPADLPSFADLIKDKDLSFSQSYLSSSQPVLEESDRLIGNKNAKLKVFVYEDYDDVFSAELSETLYRLVSENNNVAVVSRPYIGSSVNSSRNALALHCASLEGKWVDLRENIFSSLLNDLENEGAPIDYNSDCLTNGDKSAKIEELRSQASRYSVFGSPTIFIGNEIILGARPYDDYQNSEGKTVEGLKSVLDRVLGE